MIIAIENLSSVVMNPVPLIELLHQTDQRTQLQWWTVV